MNERARPIKVDIQKILEILPHRYPFVLVDRVTGDLSVVGLDAQRMPYATWRQGRTAALMRAGK